MRRRRVRENFVHAKKAKLQLVELTILRPLSDEQTRINQCPTMVPIDLSYSYFKHHLLIFKVQFNREVCFNNQYYFL